MYKILDSGSCGLIKALGLIILSSKNSCDKALVEGLKTVSVESGLNCVFFVRIYNNFFLLLLKGRLF